MAASANLSPRALALLRTFRAAFAALDDHKSQLETNAVYEAIAAHLRSAAPMALLGTSEVLDPAEQSVVQLDGGARVEFRVLDGLLNLYVIDSTSHDASVSARAGQVEQLRRELTRVQGAVK